MLRLLDLFSGIGGFSLGLERTNGFKTVAFCEIEPFCRQVLKKHWPEVPCYEDIRGLTARRLRDDGISVDAICGGFPCQDISSAGRKAGLDGKRSGLWSEYFRLISEIRPRYVIVENVSDLLNRGIYRVLGDLASIGFNAEWHCISAVAVGAPHIRDRLWIVAYPDFGHVHSKPADSGNGRSVSPKEAIGVIHRSSVSKSALAHPNSKPALGSVIARQKRNPWNSDPKVARVVDGVPAALVRPQLKSLGNAVVPQIPELIGRAILARETA